MPVKKEVVDLGESPYREPGVRNTLSCYYFAHLMVKEYDQGVKGAQWLAIFRSPGKLPECVLAHESGERVIEQSEWPGWFKGVKGSLVFFDGDDSANGSLLFAIYDSVTGQEIFRDSAYDPTKWLGMDRPLPYSVVRVISTTAGYSLRYVRVIDAGCDLYSQGTACWQGVKARLGLATDDKPLCRGYDDHAVSSPPTSVIAYAVEVALPLNPTPRSVVGPSMCWPVN